MIRLSQRSILLALPLVLCFTGPTSSHTRMEGFTVSPVQIRVGTFYHGRNVRIDADVLDCDDAIIKIEGPEERLVLNRKGKLAVVWMNVGKVKVEHAPIVYMLASSNKPADICSLKELEKFGLGIEALKDRISFEGGKTPKGLQFDEFMKLKKHNGTYNIDGTISMTPVENGRRKLSAAIPVPATMPAGEYPVELYCFKDGKMVNVTTERLVVETVGLPLLVSTLAHEHAALYGITAILVAMFTGIIMGVIFNSRIGSRH